MKLRTDKESFFRKVWNDPVLRFLPVLFAVVHLPYFLPGISLEQHETYVWLLSTLLLLPFSVLILWPSLKYQLPNNERKFWKLLSLAFALWWTVSLINLLWFTNVWEALWINPLWSVSVDVTIDSLYFGFYICWLIALSFKPHVRHDKSFGIDRTTTSVADIVRNPGQQYVFVHAG